MKLEAPVLGVYLPYFCEEAYFSGLMLLIGGILTSGVMAVMSLF